MLLCFPVSMREIYLHLSHWYLPHVQRYVVRILWMVPIYGLEAWLSLRFKEYGLYLKAFRECEWSALPAGYKVPTARAAARCEDHQHCVDDFLWRKRNQASAVRHMCDWPPSKIACRTVVYICGGCAPGRQAPWHILVR